MFKLTLQIARTFARPISFPSKRHLRQNSNSASDRTMCVNRAVHELQATQGTTTNGHIVNKICIRLANDKATAHTEQLIWLAKHALETSAVPMRNTDRSHEFVSRERPEKDEDKQKAAASEANGKQSQESVSVWPSM